jgi:hypothetical protein
MDKLIQYWIEGSDDNFKTMTVMFDSKKFNWSLSLII